MDVKSLSVITNSLKMVRFQILILIAGVGGYFDWWKIDNLSYVLNLPTASPLNVLTLLLLILLILGYFWSGVIAVIFNTATERSYKELLRLTYLYYGDEKATVIIKLCKHKGPNRAISVAESFSVLENKIVISIKNREIKKKYLKSMSKFLWMSIVLLLVGQYIASKLFGIYELWMPISTFLFLFLAASTSEKILQYEALDFIEKMP